MTAISGWPAQAQVGLDDDPAGAVERRAGAARQLARRAARRRRRRPRSRCGRRAGARRARRRRRGRLVGHALGIDAGHLRSRCARRRRAARAARAARSDSSRHEGAEHAVGAFEQDDARRASSRCGGTRSRSVCCAISLIVPAISTPVGPPPMTTKVIQASRLGRVGARARRCSKAPMTRARMSNASASVFRPGRVRRPLVVAEVAVGRAGGDDQVVVGDALAAVERSTLRAGDVDRRAPRPCRIVRLPRFISLRSTWRIGALTAGALRPAVATW